MRPLPVYSKPHLSLERQLALLKQRGMIVGDDAEALSCLQRNGYYRLSAYWYPFRKIEAGFATDTFLDESRFEDVQALYIFDKDLKLILLDAIERVEIAVRVQIAHLLGRIDIFAHENAVLLRSDFTTRIVDVLNQRTAYDEWLSRFDDAVKRSKEKFVERYYEKYDGTNLPIWIAIELWDFGMLSRFYSGMRIADKNSVANHFGIAGSSPATLLESWLRCLNYIRNVIAHHSRLWNSNLVDVPKLPRRRDNMSDFDHLQTLTDVNKRVYSVCCILAHFSRQINPQSKWIARLQKHLLTFPPTPHASLQSMGFPMKWETQNLWRPE